jgi:hypothetical protein
VSGYACGVPSASHICSSSTAHLLRLSLPRSQIKASKMSSTGAARRRRATSASRPRSSRRGDKPFPPRPARPRPTCPLASSRWLAARARARTTTPRTKTLARRSGSPAKTRGTGLLPVATLSLTGLRGSAPRRRAALALRPTPRCPTSLSGRIMTRASRACVTRRCRRPTAAGPQTRASATGLIRCAWRGGREEERGARAPPHCNAAPARTNVPCHPLPARARAPPCSNGTHCYELSSIHPRVKHIVGARLARALVGMLQGKPQPTPKLAGCRLAGQRLVLSFDAPLLGGEAVVLQAPVPGTFVPLEFQVANANVSAGTSGWVFAASLEAVNATAVAAVLPPGAGTPTAVRYAWGDYACCPGMNASTFFCPPTSCPIVTSVSQEPAVPFWASIDGGQCHCTPPWSCDA